MLEIWRSQYYQYIFSHKRLPRLEEALEKFSASELEQWVVARISADRAWESNSATPVRTRTVAKPSNSSFEEICIVPGGRWLLASDTQGCIRFYDLDAPDRILGRTLLESGYHLLGDWRSLAFSMCISVDEQASTLTFTLSYSPTVPGTGGSLAIPFCLSY